MYDAVPALQPGGRAEIAHSGAAGLQPRGYLLATIHRAYNTDDPAALLLLGALQSLEETVILPLHPRTRQKKLLGFRSAPGGSCPSFAALSEPLSDSGYAGDGENARLILDR